MRTDRIYEFLGKVMGKQVEMGSAQVGKIYKQGNVTNFLPSIDVLGRGEHLRNNPTELTGIFWFHLIERKSNSKEWDCRELASFG